MTSHRLQTVLWIAFGLFLLWLLRLLSPILAPFLLGGIFAYICNPVVERLEHWRMPKLAAVLLVVVAFVLTIALLFVLLIPLVQEELTLLVSRTPDIMALINDKAGPWLRAHFGIRLRTDPVSIRKLLNDNFGNLQSIGHLFNSMSTGGRMALDIAITTLLTPIVLFYLLLDWRSLLARAEALIPRGWHIKTMDMLREVDIVLSEFLRGQILVMLILAVYYSSALWLTGLPSALSVGVFTGLLIFIPYIGYCIGLILALLIAGLQFEGFSPVMWVLIIYGIGQALEGVLLTPWLVGRRIGLHPLAVLFALFAFGQLFGFVGILIALPASAALLVGLREVRTQYLKSHFYRGNEENH